MYVHERAAASGRSVREVLQDMVNEAADAAKTAESLLEGSREKRAWKAFADGFFWFHVCCGRYRLDELGVV